MGIEIVRPSLLPVTASPSRTPGPRFAEAGTMLAGMKTDHLMLELDIRSVAQCRKMIADAAAWGGGIDVLVNAAGIWLEGPSEDVTRTSGTA